MAADINVVTLPLTVNAGQTFKIEVSVDFNPLTYNDIENADWNYIDSIDTWNDIEKTTDDIAGGGTGGRQVRYIGDLLSGNSVNSSNHWVEIQAIDLNNNNVALNKVGFLPDGINTTTILTDGNINSNSYISSTAPGAVMVDLGAVYTLKAIKIWHYYADGRKYNNTTLIATDEHVWEPIFESINGQYIETSEGHTIEL